MQGRGSMNPGSVDTIVEKGSLLACDAGIPGAQKGTSLFIGSVWEWRAGLVVSISFQVFGGGVVCLFCDFLFSCWVFLF